MQRGGPARVEGSLAVGVGVVQHARVRASGAGRERHRVAVAAGLRGDRDRLAAARRADREARKRRAAGGAHGADTVEAVVGRVEQVVPGGEELLERHAAGGDILLLDVASQGGPLLERDDGQVSRGDHGRGQRRDRGRDDRR